MSESKRARVIVVGNEKGGSGKSTTAIHLIVGLAKTGLAVARFGERVIYRELFFRGLTVLDLKGEATGSGTLLMSHVAARQEVRNLVEAIGGW